MKYCIVGCGAMGSAIAKGLTKQEGISDSCVLLYDADQTKCAAVSSQLGAQHCHSLGEAVGLADTVILAVKPHIVNSVLSELKPIIKESILVVSIAAGITISSLQCGLPQNQPVVRVMPNVGLQVGKGASAFSLGSSANSKHAETVSRIFGGENVCVQVEERLMNAVTGLSGSGPAYALLVIEALADGGVFAGLPKQTAILLAAQCLAGAAALVLDTNEHPAIIKDKVTTPAGTTIAGLNELEQAGVRHALMSAVMAAKKRADELA